MSRAPRVRRDPHAHVIHAPGRRLLHRLPLPFVRSRAAGHATRSPNASLNLVSLIDFLVVTVIFLLMSFSDSSEAKASGMQVPSAVNVEALVDAPMVTVFHGQILVDGVAAGSTRSVEEPFRMEKIDPLFQMLRAKRELWLQIQPDRPFPGVCVLAIDEETPAIVVKSLFQTAAFAGYPNVSFLVKTNPEPRQPWHVLTTSVCGTGRRWCWLMNVPGMFTWMSHGSGGRPFSGPSTAPPEKGTYAGAVSRVSVKDRSTVWKLPDRSNDSIASVFAMSRRSHLVARTCSSSASRATSREIGGTWGSTRVLSPRGRRAASPMCQSARGRRAASPMCRYHRAEGARPGGISPHPGGMRSRRGEVAHIPAGPDTDVTVSAIRRARGAQALSPGRRSSTGIGGTKEPVAWAVPQGSAMKKKTLKASFVMTFAGTAAALAAPGCGTVVTNPPIPFCPDTVPSTGQACEPDSVPVEGCTYQDECGLDIDASCLADGTWEVLYAGTCNPPAACSAYSDPDSCATDPGCRWLAPGCGDPADIPALPAAGCFDKTPCVDDTSCTTGTCQQFMVVPSCVEQGCDACAESTTVCQ